MAFKWPYISALKGAFGQISIFARNFERPFVGTCFKSTFESRFENPLSVKVLLNALKKRALKWLLNGLTYQLQKGLWNRVPSKGTLKRLQRRFKTGLCAKGPFKPGWMGCCC